MVSCNDCGREMEKTEEHPDVTIWECENCNTMQETFPHREAAIKRSMSRKSNPLFTIKCDDCGKSELTSLEHRIDKQHGFDRKGQSFHTCEGFFRRV